MSVFATRLGGSSVAICENFSRNHVISGRVAGLFISTEGIQRETGSMIELKTNDTLALRRRIDDNAATGVDPRSRYVDHYWIPTLGPTAVCLARALMRMIARRGETVEVQVEHLAAVLGLRPDGDVNGELRAAFRRLDDADIVVVDPEGGLLVRGQFPYLTEEQVAHLPAPLVEAHRSPGSLQAAAGLDATSGRSQALGPHARVLSLAATIDEILVNPSLDPGQLAFRWQHVIRLAEEARDDAVLDWAPSDLEATLAECHLAGQAMSEALWATQKSVATRRIVGGEHREALAEAAAGVIDWLVSEFPPEPFDGIFDDV
jgi:hypothetical protein